MSKRLPIAIVGMSCRLPNHANSPEEYFKKLYNKEYFLAHIDEVCEKRMNLKYYREYYPKKHPKHITCPTIGLVDDTDKFDYSAFNFNKVEANQHAIPNKVMLELAVEAFEDANIESKKSLTGVFIGGAEHGYYDRKESATEYLLVGQYKATLANIINYKLDLRGPSQTSFSACCSSGTAFHNAMLSIRDGDCNMALVGGVCLMIDPMMNSQFNLLGVLSPDGKPKVFDKNANGFVSSDAFGLVLLKRLDHALRDGNKIYAIVKDSVANSDGATTKIFTNPSKIAHRANINRIMKRNNIDPKDVAFFEMHATGTVVGDPIESEAVGMEIGQFKKKDDPLLIGSVKGNIGHTVSCAFLSSLIKVCLMIKHKVVLPNIGFKDPNPLIKWKEWNLKVPTDPVKTSLKGKYIMVNTFGIGGSNVTVLLEGVHFEDYLKRNEPKLPWKSPYLFTVYGKTINNVNNRIKQLKEFSESVKDDARLMYTLNTRKQKNYAFRSFCVSKDIKSAKFSTPERVNLDKKKKICFVFSGQGPQNLKMGRQMYKEFPVFKETIDKCDKIYKEISGSSMIYDVGLFGDKVCSIDVLNKTENTIPSLIMIQIALFEFWKSIGIKPDVVVGHSFGEICSMYASGAATIEQILKIVYARVTIVNEITTAGKLMAVALSENDFNGYVDDLGIYDIWVAAFNAPKSITVGGTPKDVAKLAALLKKKGIFHRVLKINFAFHTSLVDEIEDIAMERFEKALKGTESPKIPMLSTTKCVQWKTKIPADMLTENITCPVLFSETISTLALQNYGNDCIFIELAAHPVLGRSLNTIGCENILHSLNRKFEEKANFLKNVGKLVSLGIDVNWDSLMDGGYAPFVELPSYPWTKDVCSIEDHLQLNKFRVDERRIMPPTIGRRQEMPNESWKTYVSQKRFPWIKDHTIMGRIVAPGALYTHMLFEISEDNKLKNINFLNTVHCNDIKQINTMSIFESENGKLQLWSREFGRATKAEWAKIASGERLDERESKLINSKISAPNVEEVKKRCNELIKASDLYRSVKEFMQMDYGKAFQRIKMAWRGDEEGLSLLDTDISQFEEYANRLDYLIHPLVLDAVFHSMLVGIKYWIDCFYPMSIEEIVVFDKNLPKEVYVHLLKKEIGNNNISIDFVIFDLKGKVYCAIKNLVSKRVIFRKEKETPTYSQHLQIKELPNLIDEKINEKFKTPNLGNNELITKKVLYYARKALSGLNEVYDSLPDHSQRQVRWVRSHIEKNKDVKVPQSVIDYDLKTIKDWELVGEVVDRIGPKFTAMAVNKNNEVHQTLFDDGILTRFYSRLSILPSYCKMINYYVKKFTEKEERVLRILELGAGTGSVIRELFPLLRSYGTKIEYIFSDVSAGYFNSIREEFKDYDFIRFKVIDCEKSYLKQGIPDYSIDIVLAFLVVHVAGILKDALTSIYNCLVPNGLLLLAEVDSPLYANFIFGFFSQWWTSKDWRRDSGRLNVCLTPEQYCNELKKVNFRITDEVVTNGEGNKMYIIQARKITSKDVPKQKNNFDHLIMYDKQDKFGFLDLLQDKINNKGYRNKRVLVIVGVEDVENDPEIGAGIVSIATTLRHEHESWKIAVLHFYKGITLEKKKFWMEDAVKFPYKYELENKILSDDKHLVYRMKVIEKESDTVAIPLKSPAYRLQKIKVGEMKDDRKLLERRKSVQAFAGFEFFKFENYAPKEDEALIEVKESEFSYGDYEQVVSEKFEKIIKDVSFVVGKVKSVGRSVKNCKEGDDIVALVVNDNPLCNYYIVKSDFVSVQKDNKVDLRSLIAVKAFKEAKIKEGSSLMIHNGILNEYIIQLCSKVKKINLIVSVSNVAEGKLLKSKYGDVISKIILLSNWNFKLKDRFDVVFNSINDVIAISSSLELLKMNGKFIQLECNVKFEENETFKKALMTSLFNKRVKYITIDVSEDKNEFKLLLESVNKQIKSGDIKIKTIESYGANKFSTEVMESFKTDNTSHRVKINWNSKNIPSVINERSDVFSCNKTYVISGALGEVGWNLVRMLATSGARYIVCMSRSGRTKKRHRQDIKSWKEEGVNVFISVTDVTDAKGVAFMYEKIVEMKFPKVGGIFHMALVLKDEFISRIKKEDFDYVENIKKLGTKNLIKPFKSPKDLDFILFFSSLSCLVGNSRQVNYNAGNRYVEYYSLMLRRKGYNSFCINVGSIIDAGISGWNLAVRRGMVKYTAIPVKYLLKDMASLIKTGKVVDPYEHQRYIGIDLSMYKSPSLMHFYSHIFNTQKISKSKKISKGVKITFEVLNEILKDLLMMEKDIEPDDDLINFGVDSVQSIELSSILWKKLGMKVSQSDIMNNMTINQLLKLAKKMKK